jgi:hypothetical protein
MSLPAGILQCRSREKADMTTDRETIARGIIVELTSTTGQFGSTLAAALGLPKKEVNAGLYADPRFVRSDDVKPRWYLAGQNVAQ